MRRGHQAKVREGGTDDRPLDSPLQVIKRCHTHKRNRKRTSGIIHCKSQAIRKIYNEGEWNEALDMEE